ncbi:MAG TPA: YCF48-related protein [Pyrinomonadaceae bacterium]|nr:YCF48-related protein [Pyrinomonadaceae bacterium]
MIDKSPRFRFAAAFIVIALSAVFLPLRAYTDENVFRDPAKFSDWTVVGPNGGDVRVVTFDPRDKNRLYISTMDGQIHTSADGGKSWTLLVNLNEPQLILDQLFVDSRDSKVIYTSGHRGKFPGGFFKSVDGGATWKESKDLRKEAIHAMTQAKDDPNMLFVGSSNGVFVSKNSGDDWEKISSSTMPVNLNSMAIDPRKNSTIYAGTNWRPYKSTDGGQSWRLIKAGMIDDSDVFAVTIDPRNAEHIIASACSGIYESFSGGDEWKKIQGIPSQSRRTRDIVQHPTIAGTVYAGTTEGFWLTTNGGKSWALTTQRNLEINSIAVHPEEPNRVFIATNNYGVMVSNDGGKNFTQTNEHFTSRFAYSVTPDIAQPGRLYATTQNTASSGGFFFTSMDGGKVWTQAKGLDINRVSPFAVLQDRVDPNRIFLGSNVGIFRSLDRGISWTLIAPPKPKVVKKAPAKAPVKKAVAKTPPATPSPEAIKPAEQAGPKVVPAFTEKVKVLAFTEDDKNGIFAGTDNGLYRTYDIDKGWEKLPFGEGLNENVFVVYSSPLVPGTIWVGTATSGVIVSKDDGKTWAKVDGLPEKIPVSSITSDPKRPNYLYVGTTQSIYLSRDGGRTWARTRGTLPLGNYVSILIDPNNTDEIFAASALEADGGIFYSEDAGLKWRRVDSKDMKVPSRRVWTMAFDPSNPRTIFAGSHSSGVYRIERRQESATGETNVAKPATTDGN